jgi:ADP-ribose pyrophosphatase YjhB (NUDIX family)
MEGDVTENFMPLQESAARDGEEIAFRANGQDWIVSWNPPRTPPGGTPHGAVGVCVTGDGGIVLISPDGEHWGLPGGRPEGCETWEETLRREMLEEACATVVQARLLGYLRSACVAGPQVGLVLVRSVWRAEVELAPWEPRFEIPHRRVGAAAEVWNHLALEGYPARIINRLLHEASIM